MCLKRSLQKYEIAFNSGYECINFLLAEYENCESGLEMSFASGFSYRSRHYESGKWDHEVAAGQSC